MRSFFVIVLFLIVSFYASGKEKKDLIKANYYYEHYAYHEAIPFFEEYAVKERDVEIYMRLADCYRMTNNLQKASKWYAKAIKKKGCKDYVLLHYAQVLMQLMQYDDAEKVLIDYQKMSKADRRATNMIAGCHSAPKRLNASAPGPATLLEFNANCSEFAPTLWKGNLVFTADTAIEISKKTDRWTGSSYYNIYTVTTDPKGHCGRELRTITETKDVNIKYHDGPCTFSADGKEMYFTRTSYDNRFFGKHAVANSNKVVPMEIMIASEYDAEEKKFKKVKPFEYNNKEYSVAHPTVSPDGKMLIFSSDMHSGSGGSDLYMCKKGADGSWSTPKNLGNVINTEGEEAFPYLADNNTLFFSSDGHEGLGGLDIYVCKLDEKTKTWSAPENVGIPINSSYDDISLALFADGRSTYFSSNRPAKKSGDNIYYYKCQKAFLQLKVTDGDTHEPLQDVSIVSDAANDNINVQVDNNGSLFRQLALKTQYNINISKAGYVPKSISVNTSNIDEVDTITRTVVMSKVPLSKDTLDAAVKAPYISKSRRFDSPAVMQYVISEVYEISHFNYNVNEFGLNSIKKEVLDSLAGVLKHHPTMEIEIRAHTDCRGTAAYNLKLSNERAGAVVKYLVNKGISAKRLKSIGYGSTQPLTQCPDADCSKCTDKEHYENRVIEFKVLQL